MDRRAFFKRSLDNTVKTAVKSADAAVTARIRWIRPPYARHELEFLVSCTRCGDCIDACQYNVIFPLRIQLGVQVAGTPALDLLQRWCRLCAEFPCVRVCQPQALQLDETHDNATVAGKRSLPRLAIAKIDTAKCLPYQGPECGGCAGSCPIENTLLWNKERPTINQISCIGCAQCRDACIVNPKAIMIEPLHVQANKGATQLSENLHCPKTSS